MRVHRTLGADPEQEAEATIAAAKKELQNNVPMISHENHDNQIHERRFVVYHCDERRRPKTGRPRGGLSD
jgi:hypothetical protein